MVMIIQIAMKSSRFNKNVLETKSAFDKISMLMLILRNLELLLQYSSNHEILVNFVTLAEIMPIIRKQLPNLNQILLKRKVNNIGTFAEPVTTLPNKLPKIGPVQENETITKVKTIKENPDDSSCFFCF